MRVGIDLDGVCYDFGASVRAYLATHRGFPVENMPAVTRWEFYEDWGLSPRYFLDACHAGVEAGVIFNEGDPFPGTKAGFEALRADGHTIHIITDRSFGSPGASAAVTLAWLARHGLPYDTITFSPDKTIVAVDTMVDDKPANVEALVGAGVATWVFDQEWNAGTCAGVPRVSSLLEYADVIVEACADA